MRDSAQPSAMTATLTVVICTHDRAPLLRRALASLNAATRPADADVDILVVPNACRDGTEAMLAEYQREQAARGWLPLRFEAEPRQGKSYALNRAIGLLKADLVAHVDDDHRVDAAYLTAIAEAAALCPDFDIFCGRILPDWDGTEPSWVHDTGPYRIYPLPVPRWEFGPDPAPLPAGTALPGGGNLFLRPRIFARVGDFSPEFGPRGHDLGGGEDTEWLRRAMAMGARIRYAPSVVQYHYVDGARLTLPYLLRKAFSRSSSVVRLDGGSSGGLRGYMFRKLATYAAQALFSAGGNARRFYLVRTAAALGEIDGALRHRRG